MFSCHGHLVDEERSTGAHWIGGWISCKDGLDSMEEKLLPKLGIEI